MDVFRNCSISTKQCFRSAFAWSFIMCLFPATGRWCWCRILDSHFLAFLNSVSLLSRRHESIYAEATKLQVMKPSTQVWHHNSGTPRRRLSSSHAFRSVTFAYDESISWLMTRYFAAQKVVQITVCVLYHILVDDPPFELYHRIIPFWKHVEKQPWKLSP
jgi:hypothetical protein